MNASIRWHYEIVWASNVHTGTWTLENILTPLRTSIKATSWGVETINAPAGNKWKKFLNFNSVDKSNKDLEVQAGTISSDAKASLREIENYEKPWKTSETIVRQYLITATSVKQLSGYHQCQGAYPPQEYQDCPTQLPLSFSQEH